MNQILKIQDLLSETLGLDMNRLLFASRALEDHVNLEELTKGACRNPLDGLATIMTDCIETYNYVIEEIDKIKKAPGIELSHKDSSGA